MQTDNKEKIIDKIRKVLELSKNNPSKEEAEAAALKAQKMLAEYHIEMADIESVSAIEEITEVQYYTGTGNKWKYSLASTIASNFRCCLYVINKSYVVFYGYETDAQVAKEVFENLFNLGKRLAGKEYDTYKRKYGTAPGVMNTFYVGFVDGIRSVLEKQCTALVLVVPQLVKDNFKEVTKGTSQIRSSLRYNSAMSGVYDRGYNSGRDAINARAIAIA